MENFEKTKMTKYCDKPGCKEMFVYQLIDEDTDEKIALRLWMAFAELREAKRKCRHGEPEKFKPLPPFRVIGVDTFSNDGDFPLGTYKTLAKAKAVAQAKGGTMLKTHVYDAKNRHVFDAGTF